MLIWDDTRPMVRGHVLAPDDVLGGFGDLERPAFVALRQFYSTDVGCVESSDQVRVGGNLLQLHPSHSHLSTQHPSQLTRRTIREIVDLRIVRVIIISVPETEILSGHYETKRLCMRIGLFCPRTVFRDEETAGCVRVAVFVTEAGKRRLPGEGFNLTGRSLQLKLKFD